MGHKLKYNKKGIEIWNSKWFMNFVYVHMYGFIIISKWDYLHALYFLWQAVTFWLQILFVAILLAELYICAFFHFLFSFLQKGEKKKKSLPSRLIADGVTTMGSFAQGSIFLGTWIGRLNELCWCQHGTNFTFKSWSFIIQNNNKNWEFSWCIAQTVHLVWLYSISYLWHDIEEMI